VSLSEPRDFEAIAGKGVRATVDGKAILLGNRRLALENGGDISAAEQKLVKLEEDGKTAMILVVDGKAEGAVAVADTVKPSAKPTIDALKGMGIQVVMLTGDNSRTAAAIARKLGIERVVAEVLPQQKEETIVELQKEG